jgi:hypothetical protein
MSITTRAVASSALLCLLLATTTTINHACCANTKHKKAHHASSPVIPTTPPPTNPGGGYTINNNGSSGGWLNARATWYGAPNGAGPEDNGGACGFKNVHMPPFSAMTSCGNDPIFKDGLGCGSCYQVCSHCF